MSNKAAPTKPQDKSEKPTLKTDTSNQDIKSKNVSSTPANKGSDKTEKHDKNEKNASPEKGRADKAGKGQKESDKSSFFLTESKANGGRESQPPKPENVLVSTGLLDAYDYLQQQICKHGFPKGNVFEYAAITMLKYERKMKATEAVKKLEEREREKEKEREKSKKPVEIKEEARGRSPKHHDEVKTSQVDAKGKDNKSKSPLPKEEEVKGKGKFDKSPPPKEEEHKGKDKGKDKGGKDDKGGKGGKEDEGKKDKNTSKSPPGKDAGHKADAVIEDKNAKKAPPKEAADSGKAGKKK